MLDDAVHADRDSNQHKNAVIQSAFDPIGSPWPCSQCNLGVGQKQKATRIMVNIAVMMLLRYF
jgi:hypothetical protein